MPLVLAEARGFEPLSPWRLHDFQSCPLWPLRYASIFYSWFKFYACARYTRLSSWRSQVLPARLKTTSHLLCKSSALPKYLPYFILDLSFLHVPVILAYARGVRKFYLLGWRPLRICLANLRHCRNTLPYSFFNFTFRKLLTYFSLFKGFCQ